MTKLSLATIATAVVLSTGLAHAADLPRAAPAPYKAPAVVPMFSWTGFYIGANIGAGWLQGDVTSNFGATWNRNGTAFIGGGQLGYNYQMGSFVFGVEADIDATAGSKSSGFVTTIPYGAVKAVGDWNWVATAAARLGYAFDRTLLYGKVGYGWSNTSAQLQNSGGVQVGAGTSNTNGGLLLGAGVEYAFTNNWTAKLEYNWIDLSNRTVIVTGANTITTNPDIQMVKAGVNYKF